jgi:hypothetical protein
MLILDDKLIPYNQTAFEIEFLEINFVYNQTKKMEMKWIPIDSIPPNSIFRKVILRNWFNSRDPNGPEKKIDQRMHSWWETKAIHLLQGVTHVNSEWNKVCILLYN